MLSAQEIQSLSRAQLDWAVETRRALHRVPEKGFAEEKTKALIVQSSAKAASSMSLRPAAGLPAGCPERKAER